MVIKLWIIQVCSSGVTSLKTVKHLCMMIRGVEDLQLWKKLKMRSLMIAEWLWMNFLQCFCKSPDLCYTKPSKKPSDIGNHLWGGSQNNWQTNTSRIEWRPGKSFWDATNSMEMNFSTPLLLECTWMKNGFQSTRRCRSGQRGWRETTLRKTSKN